MHSFYLSAAQLISIFLCHKRGLRKNFFMLWAWKFMILAHIVRGWHATSFNSFIYIIFFGSFLAALTWVCVLCVRFEIRGCLFSAYCAWWKSWERCFELLCWLAGWLYAGYGWVSETKWCSCGYFMLHFVEDFSRRVFYTLLDEVLC